MYFKKLILVVFAFISSVSVWAHSGNIKGTVVDSLSGLPISDADVIIEGSPWRTVTDEAGNFIFNNIPDGKYMLVITHLSYRTVKIAIEVEGDKTLNLKIKLQQSNFTIAETAIIGNKEPEKMLTRLNKIDVELRPIYIIAETLI